MTSVIGKAKGEPVCSLVFVLVCGSGYPSSGLRALHQQCPLNLFSPWPLPRGPTRDHSRSNTVRLTQHETQTLLHPHERPRSSELHSPPQKGKAPPTTLIHTAETSSTHQALRRPAIICPPSIGGHPRALSHPTPLCATPACEPQVVIVVLRPHRIRAWQLGRYFAAFRAWRVAPCPRAWRVAPRPYAS